MVIADNLLTALQLSEQEIVQPFPTSRQAFFFTSELFPKQALVFMCLQYKSFENTVGKGEIAHNKQFLLFPPCFLTLSNTFLPFSSNL